MASEDNGKTEVVPDLVEGISNDEKRTIARKRHGKPFGVELGSQWGPNSVPVLTMWMQSRGRNTDGASTA